MDHVGARDLAHEERQVDQLVDDRAEVFHVERESKRSRRQRVDRHEPRVDVGIIFPRREQPIRLDRLPAKDSERRSNERDFDPVGHGDPDEVQSARRASRCHVTRQTAPKNALQHDA